MSEQRFLLTASPHLASQVTLPKVMWTVVWSLVPVLLTGMYFFGPSALFVALAGTAGACVCEGVFKGWRMLADGSAVITGLLLGLSLPPGFPMWMAFLGGVFGILLGKLIFGGLGYNIFNPAMLGRAFLQAAFPVAITTWPKTPGSWFQLRGDNFAWPFLHPHTADIVTSATPLGLAKFEHLPTPLLNLMIGNTGGSVGETGGLVILACGAFLVWKKMMSWRTPASLLATVAVFATILHTIDPQRYPGAGFMLFSGGLMLGAVYMATDPVTSPVSHRGAWIFGAGIGVLVVLIRIWGGLPEGVMYAILLMNVLVPFINRATQPRVFGAARLAEKSS